MEEIFPFRPVIVDALIVLPIASVRGCAGGRRSNTATLMDTRLLTKITVGSKVGVSFVSSISESVSEISWICLAFAKHLRSLSGRKRHCRAVRRFLIRGPGRRNT